MEFFDCVRERFSVRKFKSKKIKQEELDVILEAGRLAPTAKNIQPIKIYIVQSEEGLEKIDKASPCRYNSETVLLVCGNKKEAFSKEDYSTYEMDASIVTTHMMLEATNIGVGSIWIEKFDGNILKEEFEIPEELEPVCLLPIGYNDGYEPSIMHSARKDINEIVEYR